MENRDLPEDGLQVEKLTWREQEILSLLSERMTNREIADHLNLAESTVKDYVGKILSKLYVKNRREAVERARTLGLLDTDNMSAVKPRTNFPTETTSFIGRADERKIITNVLVNTRLECTR